MLLEHPDLSPFEPVLKRCMALAHTTGLQALEGVGRKLADIGTSRGAYRRFIRGCHYGYDSAQRQIGALVIDLEEKILANETELKALRRQRSPRARNVLELVKILQTRQLVLRRLIDSILWSILSPTKDQWAMRHLSIEGGMKRIEPRIVRRLVEVATGRNRSDRLKFNLVCDLTTGAQVGDFIEVDRSTLSECSWKVVELKEGRVNAILTSAITGREGKLSKEDLQGIERDLGKHAIGQARRMLRQRSRQAEIERMVVSNMGISPQYNMQVRFFEDRSKTFESYSEAVQHVCREVAGHGVSAAHVDECLSLVAINSENLPNNDYRAVAHLFYHLAQGGGECFLNDAERRRGELRAMVSIPPFVDLVEQNMLVPWGLPIFLWTNDDRRILDLVSDRVRLFVQFDMKKFFEMAKASGIALAWVTKRLSADLRRLSARIPGSPGAWAISARSEDGTTVELLCGLFRRAVADLTSPRALIQLIQLYGEQARKHGIQATFN
jgi:hypothetical protein